MFTIHFGGFYPYFWKHPYIFPWVKKRGLQNAMLRKNVSSGLPARLSTRSCHETHYCYCSPKTCLNPTGGVLTGKNGGVGKPTNNGPFDSHQKETRPQPNLDENIERDAGKNAHTIFFFLGGVLVCISYTRWFFFKLQNSGWFFCSVQQQESGNVKIRQMRP